MSPELALAIGTGAVLGTFAGRLVLEVWLAARRRDIRRLTAARRELEGPAEVPPPARSYWADGEPIEMMDPGEGLLW